MRDLLESQLEKHSLQILHLETQMTGIPGLITQEIEQATKLHNEKFRSIERQFQERDVRIEQNLRDSKDAVTTALMSAKEAVSTQNLYTTKQIDALSNLFQTSMKALEQRLDEARGNLLLIEGRGSGIHNSLGTLFAVIGALGVIVGLFFALRR